MTQFEQSEDGSVSDGMTDIITEEAANGSHLEEETIELNEAGKLDDEEKTIEKSAQVTVEIETEINAPDVGWGWFIVLGCILLRTIVGGIARSSGIFYLKFLERFGGTAAQTAWVSSLAMTVRLLVGPIISILCGKLSIRMLTFIGAAVLVISLHLSAYATSLTYLYVSNGVVGGLGRSLVLTPMTFILGAYFCKRRSLAFGLASTGFGVGGLVITPTIELLFQTYGFRGTYIMLSGIACHLFVCSMLFRPLTPSIKKKKYTKRKDKDISLETDNMLKENDESVVFLAKTSSASGIGLEKPDATANETLPNIGGKLSKPNNDIKESLSNKTKQDTKSKKELISFSVLKDIRFLTYLVATFINTLPNIGLFLPAMAKSRGLTDIEAAYILSLIAASETVAKIICGFILDLKGLRDKRPYIYNAVSFMQCVAVFLFPSANTLAHYIVLCCLHGVVMGTKAAQRGVILVDILGLDKLPSSFAILLGVEGLGTLIGPPVNGFLKDRYGIYDYTYYFGGTALFVSSMILAGGNLRNYCNSRKSKT